MSDTPTIARRRGKTAILRKEGQSATSLPATMTTPPPIQQALGTQGMDSVRDLGPGTPLRPYQGYSLPPRVMDYPVGVNISVRTRQSWGRMSFDTLRALIDAYDVARMCINHKIDELRSMEPLFVPLDSYRGNADDAVDAAQAAMEFPDREHPWDEWLGLLLEGPLRYDATALYRRRTMDRTKVCGLEVLDGTTIYPYIDEHGRKPTPPAPAYYQLIHGLVWDWYTTDDIIYPRFRPQSDTPYGLAPMESLLLTANTDIRFQWHFLQMFTDGSVPAGFVEVPPDISSPDQVAEWQDYWDAIVMGDQAKLHQLVAVPAGTKVTTTRPEAFDKAFPQYLMVRTCGAFGVVPQDLGLIEDVNRANGETQVDIQFRVNTLPWVRWVQGIVTRYLRYDLGLPVQLKLDTGRDKEDRFTEAQAWGIYIDKGIASVDEARQELLGLQTDNERPVPRFYADPRTGPIPLGNIEAISGVTDPETAAPVDDEPLSTKPFDGAGGVLPDKAPGGTQFKRAPINPDEPEFPQLEKPIPGTDVVGTKPGKPVIGDPNPSGIPGAQQPVQKAEADELAEFRRFVKAEADELAEFRRFVKARERSGRWRDFRFETVAPDVAAALNAHHRERLRKAADAVPFAVTVAGLAVLAADTGRVLLLQRALDVDDPAGGCWEFPGGHMEDGEPPHVAAVREWCEEVGQPLPPGRFTGSWQSGCYEGLVWQVRSETDVDLTDRDSVANPDDPDGDIVEAVAWWYPSQLADNPSVRSELSASLPVVLPLLGADTVTVAKAASDPWQAHPARHVEDALADFHAKAIRAALQAMFPADRLRAVVEAYAAKHPVDDNKPSSDE